MKVLTAISLVLLASAAASAQRGGSPHPPPPSAVPARPVGALGGSYASVGISRPLGGIIPPSAHGKYRGRGTAYGYVGPIYYVPNAYDLGYYSSSTFNTPADPALYYTPPPPSFQPSQPSPQASAAPVIINQYFGRRTSNSQSEDGNTTTTSEFEGPAVNPGDPVGTPQRYYLIAYKDRSVYSALAYWLEGDTLHYVTTQNTHNQASLSLVDLEQTAKLNTDASMPFSLK